MHEFRTRLIADTVTGKFDTREAVATLPETDGDDSRACSNGGFRADSRWGRDGLGPTFAETEA